MPHGIGARVSQLPRVMTTTTTSPREMHWQTLLGSLVYTAIIFLRTLYSYFRAFRCNVNRLDPVLNVPESFPCQPHFTTWITTAEVTGLI